LPTPHGAAALDLERQTAVARVRGEVGFYRGRVEEIG
jgi:hypothetical protein